VIRVLLADDDELVRAGLAMILDAAEGITVVGEAATGSAAIEAARTLRPDVVLMDVRMPDTDGIEATRAITTGGDDAPKVLVVTTFEVDEYVFDSLRCGASGFLLKRTPPQDLVAGIRAVATGDALLAPSVTRRLIETFAGRGVPREASARLGALTERELETLRLVARGLNNAELAQAMFVSESTAKTHLRRVLMKLGLRDRVAAVIFAYEAGLT
jgi:DNA-binding NarL/FixJ family response regulator